MLDWYYETHGERLGPVAEDRLRELIGDGTLGPTNLVWNKEFSSWKRVEETILAPVMVPDSPPPLPNETAVNSGRNQIDERKAVRQDRQTDVQEFLTSDLAPQLIGKNADYYLQKWKALLQSDTFDLDAIQKQTSWNWPAFLIPYGWLVYRKMYGYGAIVVAVVLISQLFGPLAIVGAILSAAIVGIYANALYFRTVYRKWLTLRTIGDADLAQQTINARGGTNTTWAVGVVLAVVFVAGILSSERNLFSTELSCSSSATRELVASIARDQIPKDGYMRYVVDEKLTKISLDGIRTQATERKVVRCAASITYNLALKSPEAEPARAPLEKVLNRDITYKVEKTDQGNQLYATVYGLQN